MSGGEAPSSSPSSSSEDTERQRHKRDADATVKSEDAPQQPVEAAVEEQQGDDLARCPICQFIEAGECKEQHQDWVSCRSEAKAAGKDYIEECQDKFKAFLQCAIDHRDYYEPFLEMLGGLPDEEEEEQEKTPAVAASSQTADA